MAVSYTDFGNIEKTRGEFEKARQYFCASLAIHEKLGNQKEMVQCYIRLGLLYHDDEAWKEAEVFFRKARELLCALESPKGLAWVDELLGDTLRKSGALEESKGFYARSLMRYRQLKDGDGMINIFQSLGKVFNKQGHLEMAADLWKHCVTLCHQLGRKDRLKEMMDWIQKLHTPLSEESS